MLALALALPVAGDDQLILEKVLDHHVARTQSYFRGAVIVSNETNEAPRPRLVVSEILGDDAVAAQIEKALATPREPLALTVASTRHYDIVAIGDRGKVAEAFPAPTVWIELSRPVYDESSTYAVVRVQSHGLRGVRARESWPALYAVRRESNGKWFVMH